MSTNIPLARLLLHAALQPQTSGPQMLTLIHQALGHMTRKRTKKATAQREGRPITPEIEEAVWDTYIRFPDRSVLSIAADHDVNPGEGFGNHRTEVDVIVNGKALLQAAPIKNMLDAKYQLHGVSYGLTEAGYDIRIKQEVLLNAEHRFTLASAIEEFDMPEGLVGIVHDKSTWARRGLSVFNTVIEPGWRGFLTLELVYHRNGPLHAPLYIPAGAGIAQVLFHQTLERASYDGKYQDQPDAPVGAKYA